ncbi:metal ABC transporter ATP-binding protein [Enterococcus sp. HY326]|uniref:metal ABC transporter ATP-binding protein n=1 Tax=Enterococcus sp. HY326 TaxID=2971265 RepID=UPI00223ECB26|nr:metal ABC transporter ATP-binding protein [Enterococcus sp. HY326]
MIICQNVSVAYQQQLALKNINLRLEDHAITGIIGPNGAGKSTLIKAILGIISFAGNITIDGKPIKEQRQQVAYVEQKSNLDFTFPITVAEFVSLGLYREVGILRRLTKKNWQQVAAALEQVGLAALGSRQISELSGGQFQRILIARCLVQEAQYIFLDEPFVGIDAVSEEIIFEILRELQQAGKTIFVVHHDLAKVQNYFDQLLILDKEVIAYGETATVFNKNYLGQAFNGQLYFGGDVA